MQPGNGAAAALIALAVATVAPWVASANAQAPTRNIYSFSRNGSGGHRNPAGSDLLADSAGNLYGSTPSGGRLANCGRGCGTVYELSPPAAAGQAWTERTLAEFTPATGNPVGNLVFDSAGDIFGTADGNSAGTKPGAGTVWKLAPPAAGSTSWTLSIIYTFGAYTHGTSNPGGAFPFTGLTIDATGTLYGVTFYGGSAGDGVVFSLTPPAKGGTTWSEQVLHNFNGLDDTKNPQEPLTVSADGSSITASALEWFDSSGDPAGYGAVYRLNRHGASSWTYRRLFLLRDADIGGVPVGALVIDSGGNIFGADHTGGADLLGTVYELSPPAPGKHDWTGQVLHSFTGADGMRPSAGLTVGNEPGVLFGTTSMGGYGGAIDGSNGSLGVVFRLDPPAQGNAAWTYTALHAFGNANPAIPAEGDLRNGVTMGRNDFLFGIASDARRRDRAAVFTQSPH